MKKLALIALTNLLKTFLTEKALTEIFSMLATVVSKFISNKLNESDVKNIEEKVK